MQPARELLGKRVVWAVRPPPGHQRLRVSGGDVDLGVQPVARTTYTGNLERDHQQIGDRDARLKATGQRDHGDRLGARSGGQLAAGGRNDPPRSQRSSCLVDRQRLLGAFGEAEVDGACEVLFAPVDAAGGEELLRADDAEELALLVAEEVLPAVADAR